MPRHFLFLEPPNLAAVALAPHVIPLASIGPIHLDTPAKKSPFTVKVLDERTQLLEVLRNTGSRVRVPRWAWRGFLEVYVENDGNADLRLYRRFGSLSSYLHPLCSLLTFHVFNEECRCFEPIPMSERRTAVKKDLVTDIWDIRD